jgi:hypothetical protein
MPANEHEHRGKEECKTERKYYPVTRPEFGRVHGNNARGEQHDEQACACKHDRHQHTGMIELIRAGLLPNP